MKSSASLVLAAAAVAFLSTSVNAAAPDYKDGLENTYIGCFKSGGDLEAATEKYTWQSSGYCSEKCRAKKARYSGLTKKFYCYCGNTLPPESDQLANSKCNLNCPGYPEDPCGSNTGDFTIFLSDETDVDERLYDPSKPIPEETSSTTSSSSSAATSTVIRQGTTTVIPTASETTTTTTATSTETEESKQESNGMNKAGAAAGAVVGVLVAIAIGVGAFLFIRKQRRQKVEEEYRRSLAVREYQKKPEADLRLDPVMLQRRMSDGSIADNQDYSRRILKVTNPDGN